MRNTQVFLLWLLTLIAVSCGSKEVIINIESTADTNSKLPFYVVVRSIDEVTYLVEDYQTVTTKVFQAPPDSTVIKSEPIHPGQEKEIIIEEEKAKSSIAIYFLFTEPGERWKTFLHPPIASSVSIELDKNQIKSQN